MIVSVFRLLSINKKNLYTSQPVYPTHPASHYNTPYINYVFHCRLTNVAGVLLPSYVFATRVPSSKPPRNGGGSYLWVPHLARAPMDNILAKWPLHFHTVL